MASGSLDGIVRLWDVVTGRLVASYSTADTEGVYSLAFSPDGSTLAVGTGDGAVWLWDLASHREVAGPLGGKLHVFDSVRSVAFASSGKTLASGADDRSVMLRDAATGQLTGELPITSGGVYAVAYSPDGKTLATGNGDGTIRLWDTGTRHLIETRTSAASITTVAFSPDGKTIASGGGDQITLWDVAEVENPVAFLCAAASRPLTRAEWAQYVPPGPAYQEICQ